MGTGTTIATLRLRSADADSPALRVRAARQLRSAALAPSGLPPAAVLVVRRLADPLPGRFGGDGLRAHPDWERAVRDELGALARAAARPDGSGRLPSDAPAVLFGDEAELVACLLADRARGVTGERWWWRCVLPRLSLPRALALEAGRDPTPILCARPREVPAAVALLARWGEAARVAAALPDAGAERALAALASAHALPDALVGGPRRTAGAAPPVAHPVPPPLAAATAEPDASPAASPWAEWAPLGVEAHTVTAPVHCLFAVAAGLHAAPSRVRSADVVSRARAWWARAAGSGRGAELPATAAEPIPFVVPRARTPETETERASSAAAAAAPPARRRADTGGPRPDPAASTPSRPARSRGGAPQPAPRAMRGSHARGRANRGRDAVTADAVAAPAIETRPREERAAADGGVAPARVEPGRRGRATAHAGAAPLSPVPAAEVTPAASGIPGEAVATRLGGIFYLIHALQDLDLPDGFGARWQADAAGPWRALDVLARALLGPRLAALADDPAWSALAALAGRSPRRTRAVRGAGASDPPFRIPKGWPARLRDHPENLRWTEAGGRIWLWSDAGYLVAHRGFRGAAAVAARREARVFGSGREPRLETRGPLETPWSPPLALPAGCPPRLGRWAAAVAPAVRRRLSLALGELDDPIAPLLVPARLFVTGSHVDVVMRAECADLRVRAAGLDRDPGWLPAYGRVVYFHFE